MRARLIMLWPRTGAKLASRSRPRSTAGVATAPRRSRRGRKAGASARQDGTAGRAIRPPALTHSSQAADLAGVDRHAPHVGIAAQQRGDLRLRPPPAPASRCNRRSAPPGLVSATALSSRRPCNAASVAKIALPLCPGDVGMAADRAGRRCTARRPASRRMADASKVSAFATAISASRRSRSKLAARRLSRSAERSTAVTLGAGERELARSCRRARRRDRRPAGPRRRRAGARATPRRRPAPTIRPRRSPSSSPTGVWLSSRTEPVGSTTPPSRCAQPSGSLLTLRSSVGSSRWARAIARAVASP